MKNAPLLSIGIIFKNEERCIERCLQSLQPLRNAIPCEVVMADTGATDGSRAIAEQYADLVIDFAWVDDFAAARNAVMDRCHGKWYLTVDCDEWLDKDISELTAFLTGRIKADMAHVIVRNYKSSELEQSELYGDFPALRLVRMSTGARYEGAIHETFSRTGLTMRLTRTVLHHDGYLYTDPVKKKEKEERNMRLLRAELERQPKSLRTLNQCIESCGEDEERLGYIRRAAELVQAKQDEWDVWGGCIFRHALEAARAQKLPEFEEWARYAFGQFGDSVFIRVDGNHAAFMHACDADEWEKAIPYGEGYRRGLRALRDKNRSQKDAQEFRCSLVHFASPPAERALLVLLANAYFQTGQHQKALKILAGLDGAKLDAARVAVVVSLLIQLHAHTNLDVQPALAALYEQISREGRDKQARLAVFNQTAADAFTSAYRAKDEALDSYLRPACTAFAVLADQCETGRAAAILAADDPEKMRGLLAKVEDWQALPIEALEHALLAGAAFPLREKPLPLEVLDGLAARLTRGENLARQLTLSPPQTREEPPCLQSLAWAQALAMAAVRAFDWTLGSHSEADGPAGPEEGADAQRKDAAKTGLALLRAFAGVESEALPLLYTPALLSEENAALLPPMHRWGFYCAQSFAALDAGQPQEYLAALRRGLAACPGQKEAVQFLLDRFQADTRPKASPELEALAQKVRAILAAYGPDHPAAKAIRESDAYKQVAWLIEDEPNGGLPVQ